MKGLRPGDRWTIAAIVCLVAGGVLLLVAWYDISGTNQLYEQLPYLVSAGFTGLALVMIGCALLISSRYDRVERRLARLVEALTEPVEDPAGAPEPSPATHAPEDDALENDAPKNDALVTVAGATHFHLPACPLVRGKAVIAVDARAIAAAELTPCPVCGPADPALP